MDFPKLLGLRPGVTAVIGSGGKTSLLRRLAEELPGTVLLCTTTHIRPFEEYPLLTAPTPEDIRKALTAHRVLCLGTPCENGKLTAPSLSVETLATLADYVLVEADGSHGLPLKAPNEKEPYLLGGESLVIAMAGMSGLQRPIAEAAHRAERYAALVHKTPLDTATPEDVAKVLESNDGLHKRVDSRFVVVLNQCDTPERTRLAQECAAALQAPCILTRLETDPSWWLDGRED